MILALLPPVKFRNFIPTEDDKAVNVATFPFHC